MGRAAEAMAGQQRQESGCIPCFNCCVTVPQDKIYAVELFGSFTKVIGSGLNVVGCDVGGRCITKRVEQNDVFVETKTKDNVFVLVRVSVQQQVIPEQAESAIYKLANVGAQIDSYVSDVVRSCVPKMTLDEAFEEKDNISSAVNDALTKSMHEYGFQIIKALVTELKPSQDVMNSMNEINKQKRLRDAAMMASEAEKIRVVKKAEADCEAARLQGEGIAKQREAIVDGLKRSVTSGTSEQTPSPTPSSSRTAPQMASRTSLLRSATASCRAAPRADAHVSGSKRCKHSIVWMGPKRPREAPKRPKR